MTKRKIDNEGYGYCLAWVILFLFIAGIIVYELTKFFAWWRVAFG